MSMNCGAMLVYGWEGANIEEIAGKEITPQMVVDAYQNWAEKSYWGSIPETIEDIEPDEDCRASLEELAVETYFEDCQIFCTNNTWKNDTYYFGCIEHFDTEDNEALQFGTTERETFRIISSQLKKAKKLYENFFGYAPATEPRFFIVNTCY